MTTNRSSGRRDPRHGLAGAAAFLAIAVTARAFAQTSAAPLRAHLSVEADPDCATAALLSAHVGERSRRIRFVDDTADIPRLHVTIGASAGRDRVARLSVQWPDGRRAERRLNARSCAAALDALSLVVAMTLDPGEAVAPGTASPSQPGLEPGGSAAPGDTAPESGAEAEAASPDAEAAPKQDATPEPQQRAPTAPVQPQATQRGPRDAPDALEGESQPFAFRHFAAGASAQLAAGPAPRAMPGVGVHALLAFHGSGLWVPALALRLAHVWTHDVAETAGDASFELDSAALDVCPLGATLGPLWAHACAAGAFGRLHASGENSYAPQTRTDPWASVGGSVLLSVELFASLRLQGGVELATPIWRYAFAFRPDVFYRIPPVCWDAHIGAAVRFP